METTSTPARENANLRPGVGAEARDAHSVGNDLTRQGRLRMDAYQTERRLKSAYSSLGEAVFEDLSALRRVDLNNGRVIELLAHIRYYHDELARLQAELKARPEPL